MLYLSQIKDAMVNMHEQLFDQHHHPREQEQEHKQPQEQEQHQEPLFRSRSKLQQYLQKTKMAIFFPIILVKYF